MVKTAESASGGAEKAARPKRIGRLPVSPAEDVGDGLKVAS